MRFVGRGTEGLTSIPCIWAPTCVRPAWYVVPAWWQTIVGRSDTVLKIPQRVPYHNEMEPAVPVEHAMAVGGRPPPCLLASCRAFAYAFTLRGGVKGCGAW